MTDREYAIVENNMVINVIVADKEFISDLPEAIDDEEIDTGDLSSSNQFVDITDLDPKPGIGWKKTTAGFESTAPPPDE